MVVEIFRDEVTAELPDKGQALMCVPDYVE